jgi:hypothetical protein
VIDPVHQQKGYSRDAAGEGDTIQWLSYSYQAALIYCVKFVHLHHLERMPCLLHRLLITLRRLTIPNILLQPLPPLPQRPQLPLQNKRNRKVHLDIRNTKLIAEQELPAALAQLRRHKVQIRLDVLRQSDFGLLGVAGLLVPAGVHD